MPKSLCNVSPCPHVCQRVNHCPAGIARCQWLAKVRNPVLKAGEKLNRETGEITGKPYPLFKLNHAGENVHHVAFTPRPQVNASPPGRPARTKILVAIDKAATEAGFGENRGQQRPYSETLVNRSIIRHFLPRDPAGTTAKLLLGFFAFSVALAVVFSNTIWRQAPAEPVTPPSLEQQRQQQEQWDKTWQEEYYSNFK